MSNAFKSHGTKVYMGATIPADFETEDTWIPIGEIVDVDPPSDVLSFIDVTNMNSPKDKEEVIAGRMSSGSGQLNLNFDPSDPTHDPTAVEASFEADKVGRVKRCYAIKLPDGEGSSVEFYAFVESNPVTARGNDKVAMTVGLKSTGDYRWQKGVDYEA